MIRLAAILTRALSSALVFAATVTAGEPLNDAELCRQTGGNWELLACDHYYCGLPQECAAVIPGCDCGPTANFEDGVGCMPDDACADVYPVQVVVDMDATTPGVQSSVAVSQCTTVLEDVAVYIIDPIGQRQVWAIGYLGGLDRGIALGHTPGDNAGTLTSMAGTPGTPVNPAAANWVDHAPQLDPGFAGPEVQYFEFGAENPALIPAEPGAPVFTVAITLRNPQIGDRFDIYLLDQVSVWTAGANGAFCTTDAYALDSGGDAVPDDTAGLYGIDADVPIAPPAAAYWVDYIDGPPGGGPAVIEVVAMAADLNGDGGVGAADLALLLGAWGPCDGSCAADLSGNGTVGPDDLAQLLGAWGGCGGSP